MLRGAANIPILFAGPSYLAQDDFSGDLSHWDQDGGTWTITSGYLQHSGTGLLIWTGGVGTNDYAIEVDMYITSSWPPVGIGVRCSAGGNAHAFRVVGAGNLQIENYYARGWNGGSSVVSVPDVTGWHTYRFEIVGDNMEAFVDGTSCLTYTSSLFPTGAPGLFGYDNGNNSRWDNFRVYAL